MLAACHESAHRPPSEHAVICWVLIAVHSTRLFPYRNKAIKWTKGLEITNQKSENQSKNSTSNINSRCINTNWVKHHPQLFIYPHYKDCAAKQRLKSTYCNRWIFKRKLSRANAWAEHMYQTGIWQDHMIHLKILLQLYIINSNTDIGKSTNVNRKPIS